MRKVFRRIAIHGGVAAFVLGLFGFMFVELSGTWIAAAGGTRSAPRGLNDSVEPSVAIAAESRTRIPLAMAAWGFAFVAIWEAALHLRRGGAKPAPAVAQQPDDAERLLDELLRQSEAANSHPPGPVEPVAANSQNAVNPPPTSSPGN